MTFEKLFVCFFNQLHNLEQTQKKVSLAVWSMDGGEVLQ